ncbi:ASAP1 [Bugula neritina]|uniref:ASAP1 n=1 Tax=Bugula neritina TaxID=10212 RepID=A0A7J7IWX3_BUGNE|nr:ASAP1 [Bugula neritina]
MNCFNLLQLILFLAYFRAVSDHAVTTFTIDNDANISDPVFKQPTFHSFTSSKAPSSNSTPLSTTAKFSSNNSGVTPSHSRNASTSSSGLVTSSNRPNSASTTGNSSSSSRTNNGVTVSRSASNLSNSTSGLVNRITNNIAKVGGNAVINRSVSNVSNSSVGVLSRSVENSPTTPTGTVSRSTSGVSNTGTVKGYASISKPTSSTSTSDSHSTAGKSNLSQSKMINTDKSAVPTTPTAKPLPAYKMASSGSLGISPPPLPEKKVKPATGSIATVTPPKEFSLPSTAAYKFTKDSKPEDAASSKPFTNISNKQVTSKPEPSPRKAIGSTSTVAKAPSSPAPTSTKPAIRPKPLAPSVSLPIRRRCRAIYDCKADNNDELSFSKDEVIVILKSPPGSSWWEGEIDGNPSRKGLFPITHIAIVNDV